jgi:hypothetical protein
MFSLILLIKPSLHMSMRIETRALAMVHAASQAVGVLILGAEAVGKGADLLELGLETAETGLKGLKAWNEPGGVEGVVELGGFKVLAHVDGCECVS